MLSHDAGTLKSHSPDVPCMRLATGQPKDVEDDSTSRCTAPAPLESSKLVAMVAFCRVWGVESQAGLVPLGF